MKVIIQFCFFLLATIELSAQQVPDFNYKPQIADPAYKNGTGSVVSIDQAHHNFHTISTRYAAFANVLRADGYTVRANEKSFSTEDLKNIKILVIANAIHESDTTAWIVPNPSAFTTKEITVIKQWVNNGGSLFLIADHMPFPGAANDLAKVFGFTFYNGFATDTTTGLYPGTKKELDVFQSKNKTLGHHEITEHIDSVASFTGQAFQIPVQATSLLTFDQRYKIFLPDTAWKFNASTKRLPVEGFSQGAILDYGKGRLAVFGEAAMFSAQLKGKDKTPFGLSSPDAPQNLSFLLNLVHWLDRKNNKNELKK
ncbi:MAG: hypothetical protein JWO58_2360 [Chitinophagaceae bacterium]|nr:hypothetical protein [Chitinophagaceae bacterium]